jgi:hypothetical protein
MQTTIEPVWTEQQHPYPRIRWKYPLEAEKPLSYPDLDKLRYRTHLHESTCPNQFSKTRVQYNGKHLRDGIAGAAGIRILAMVLSGLLCYTRMQHRYIAVRLLESFSARHARLTGSLVPTYAQASQGRPSSLRRLQKARYLNVC